jgi:hypothetical protein
MQQLDEGEQLDEDYAICSVSHLPKIMQADGAIQFRIKLTQFARKSLGTNEPNSGLLETKVVERAKLVDDINLLYENKSLMDLKIQTKDGKIFEAHKAVLGGEVYYIKLIRLEKRR